MQYYQVLQNLRTFSPLQEVWVCVYAPTWSSTSFLGYCMNFCRDHSPSSAKMHESDNQVLSEVWMVYGASSVTRPNIPVLARSTWLDEFRSMHGGFGAQ